VAQESANTVSVIDTATNTITATVPVGSTPRGVAITPSGTSAYAVNSLSNTVSVIDIATNTVTATIPVGETPLFIAFPKPQSAQDPIASLIAQVEALIAGGTLTQNQGDGLIDKLNHIRLKLDNDRTDVACNQLSAFISQVNAFIKSGALTQTQGQSLKDAANALKISLGC